MDITETIAPKSDQLNAEDLLTGPRTFTVEKVTKGSVEQPVDIHLVEFPGRPFKPSKTVRRILVAAWGPEASAYAGRRMTLYRDPSVKFGGMDVGGIRVSHLSHIGKRMSLALTVTRGKRAPYVIDPLPDAPPPPPKAAAVPPITAKDVAAFEQRIVAAGSLEELHAVGQDLKSRDLGSHHADLQALWTERRDEINADEQMAMETPTPTTNGD